MSITYGLLASRGPLAQNYNQNPYHPTREEFLFHPNVWRTKKLQPSSFALLLNPPPINPADVVKPSLPSVVFYPSLSQNVSMQIAELQSSVADLIAAQGVLQMTPSSETEQVENLQRQIQTLHVHVQDVQDQLAQERAQMTAEQQRTLDNIIQEHRKEIESHQSKVQELQKMLENQVQLTDSNKAIYESKLEEIQKEHLRIVQEQAARFTEQSNATINEIRKRYEELQQSIPPNLDQRLLEFEQQNRNLMQQNQSLGETTFELQQQRDQLQSLLNIAVATMNERNIPAQDIQDAAEQIDDIAEPTITAEDVVQHVMETRLEQLNQVQSNPPSLLGESEQVTSPTEMTERSSVSTVKGRKGPVVPKKPRHLQENFINFMADSLKKALSTEGERSIESAPSSRRGSISSDNGRRATIANPPQTSTKRPLGISDRRASFLGHELQKALAGGPFVTQSAPTSPRISTTDPVFQSFEHVKRKGSGDFTHYGIKDTVDQRGRKQVGTLVRKFGQNSKGLNENPVNRKLRKMN